MGKPIEIGACGSNFLDFQNMIGYDLAQEVSQ